MNYLIYPDYCSLCTYIYIYIHTYAFILMKRIYDRPQRQLENQNPPKDSRSGILFCYPLGHRHSTYNMCVYIYIHKMIGLTKRWDHHSSTLRKNGTHRPIEMVMKLFHFTSLSRLSLRWISGMFSLASNRHTTLAGPLR